MAKSLWGGRFKGGSDPDAFILNASISFDYRMALQDVRGSIAWAQALIGAGVLTPDEQAQIQGGLEKIAKEFESEEFKILETDEDIHTAVERRLGELIGPLAGKLHTGRSRNDQVATDFRLWLLDQLPEIQASIEMVQDALIYRAEKDFPVVMPGYTHLQQAQPVLLSHWWLSHFWGLTRDFERLSGVFQRTSVMPLGCAALAGTSFPIDRVALAKSLGFARPSPNSLDAVSDRDFAAEFLFFASMLGVHLSRLAEGVVLFSSAEFKFIELDDAYATGSSLMPQKKNPDHFELARGKAGAMIGALTGLLTTLKGLPSAYDKDLQEDKQPVFRTIDVLLGLLPVLAGGLKTLRVYPERIWAKIDPAVLATDLADYLVRKGVPFREAHHITGEVVALAEAEGRAISDLSLDGFQSVFAGFEKDVFDALDINTSLAYRNAVGGTAPKAVQQQIDLAKLKLEEQQIV